MKQARHIGSLGETKATKWKPIKKKTAVELLERNDDNELSLSAAQRKTLVEIAGDKYKQRNPLERRKGETPEQFLARLQGMFRK